MDQIKIGKFIADIRKEKGMTQRQLAEAVGVSDKTISKWETGNGMPEMSTLMPLCQVLEINVNELLSGEHLSQDSYSQKAEENIMRLIQEKEKSRKENLKDIFNAALTLVLTLLAIFFAVSWTLLLDMGSHIQFSAVIDPASSVSLFITASLALSATRLWKPFFRVFGILVAHRKYSACEVEESAATLRMVGSVMAATGAVVTIIGLITIGYNPPLDQDASLLVSAVGGALAVASYGILYGAIAYLLFLPIRYKLGIIAARLRQQS